MDGAKEGTQARHRFRPLDGEAGCNGAEVVEEQTGLRGHWWGATRAPITTAAVTQALAHSEELGFCVPQRLGRFCAEASGILGSAAVRSKALIASQTARETMNKPRSHCVSDGSKS